MSGRCLIIAGGAYCEIPEEMREAEYVIACDRGYLWAERMGIVPDLILGDFDSAPVPVTPVPLERFPSEKDDTDTMLAARRAAEKGYREVNIGCCFGGRLDHTLANLQTAGWLAERGIRVCLSGEDTLARAVPEGTWRIPRREGWSLSLFALTDRCSDVTIRGTKYEGAHLTLTGTYPLGVSNSWREDAAEITVGQGILLIIQSRLKEGEHI